MQESEVYKSGSASTSSTDSSRSGSGWLDEDDNDAVNILNNINSTFTLKSINSSQYFSKLRKMVKKLFKMVANVEKLLKWWKMVFFKICQKMVKC